MSSLDVAASALSRTSVLRGYWELTKPKVVAAIVFTAIVGMHLASAGRWPLARMLTACVGIWLAAASAAALNHVLDQRLDAAMARTRRRPLPSGQLNQRAAIVFALALGSVSISILALGVNMLTAALTLVSLIGYSVLYTAWLKPLTPQNIVIGGAAGAAPPVLGWAAIRNGIDAEALLLFLIILVWTPPHFWALAIARRGEYVRAGVPMLPVTHGVAFTSDCIVIYSALLAIITLLPFLSGMCGALYLVGSSALNIVFVRQGFRLRACPTPAIAMRAFRFSIQYLLLLFALLLIDHYLRGRHAR